MKIICKVCEKEFEGHHNSNYCSEECRKIGYKRKQIENMVNKSHKKFPDGTPKNSYVECGVCGYRTTDLSVHPSVHNLSQDEYRKKYGEIKCQDLKDSVKGDKNPAYNHGGKYSPFSKKFIHYTSDEDIQKLVDTANKTRQENHNNNTRLDYYTSRGYSEDEAKRLLKERQKTFSKEICIEKYGEKVGLKVWQERQDKWQETLTTKPEEEIAEINRKKMLNGGMYKIQENIFYNNLVKATGLDLKRQLSIKRTDDVTKYYVYDIYYKNKIIEFNGGLWHADPNIYEENDIVPKLNKTAKEIWEKDKDKLELAKSNGYDVLVVWDKDYIKNKEEIIGKCKNFLIQSIENL